MFTHNCLDPHDPFAEREVLVAFTIDASGIRLLAAKDAEGHDILPDLVDAQRDDLRCELAAQHWCLGVDGATAGRLNRPAQAGPGR
ncbi:hypothetical protein MKK84_18575 [Methylobacterium sp. E-065]|uniref:hypothetical protein n=1 Tax=Methylobacterium sp. E-065 TaxID=2836583 RepID=UPI001FBBF871|nr:hypothetical protein [Methylobacterium sp. E-065]MCJ2019418.1 hypothetical protein [Methylobacterium sp. E-065]